MEKSTLGSAGVVLRTGFVRFAFTGCELYTIPVQTPAGRLQVVSGRLAYRLLSAYGPCLFVPLLISIHLQM